MLKSRNSFFSQNSYQAQSYFPNQIQQPMINQPYQETNSQSYFYSGPNPNQTYNQGYSQNYNQNYNNFEDYENRLAKLERSINRLDARITKLENSLNVVSTDVSSSLYMV